MSNYFEYILLDVVLFLHVNTLFVGILFIFILILLVCECFKFVIFGILNKLCMYVIHKTSGQFISNYIPQIWVLILYFHNPIQTLATPCCLGFLSVW